jgi:hypothetical protein
MITYKNQITFVNWHVADKSHEYFYNGLKMLLKLCNTCIQKQRAYIEKYIFVVVQIFSFHAYSGNVKTIPGRYI